MERAPGQWVSGRTKQTTWRLWRPPSNKAWSDRFDLIVLVHFPLADGKR